MGRPVRLSFSFLLRVFRVGDLDLEPQGVERCPRSLPRALGVSAEVAQALVARDITMPFPIQELVIPDALTGADVLAKAPTGSGKTFAFGLPIVERADASAPTPTALVLVPTRARLKVAEELYFVAKPKRLRVAAAYGGASIASQSSGCAARTSSSPRPAACRISSSGGS